MKPDEQCPSCGKMVQADAVFCPACGTRLSDTKTPDKKCPACGATMDADSVFCAKCGSRFAEKKAHIPLPSWLGFASSPRRLIILLTAVLVVLLFCIVTLAYLFSTKTNRISPASVSSQEVSKIVKTEKSTYRSGEKIYVHYYGAPGLRGDWICIAPAGSPDNTYGSYQYIPHSGSGTLSFETPEPGRYEVRAFYRYNPGHYRVTGRHRFAVADW